MKEYSWKFNINADAQAVGEEIEKLEVAGEVTPTVLLEYAEENPDSEVHKCFEWDDTEAARKFRMVQASQILCSISFIVKEEPVQKQRVYVNIRTSKEGVKKFKNIKDVLEDDSEYQQLVERAKKDLDGYKEKYETLIKRDDLKDIIYGLYRTV